MSLEITALVPREHCFDSTQVKSQLHLFQATYKDVQLWIVQLMIISVFFVACVSHGSFVGFIVVCFSCFRVCSLLPCGHLLGNGWPLGSCWWCFLNFVLLSHVVSWVRCDTWLYRFLIFAVFLTFIMNSLQFFTGFIFCIYPANQTAKLSYRIND